MNLSNDAAATFISIANVASELFKAQTIAEELSITSKNARALAVRAGSTAAGFNEITRFIEGLSKLTIDAANVINEIAITQTQVAAELFRAQDFLTKLNKVNYIRQPDSTDEIQPIIKQADRKVKTLAQKIDPSLKILLDKLDETKMELRATQVVSVVSKVEASRAHSDFQTPLNSVAEKVSNAGARINTHIDNARRYLIYLDH